MEPEYKAIIDQRRPLLVERIVWSKRFSEKLRQAKILPVAKLDEIERDLNCSNRSYILLATLVMRRDATVFERFCDVLKSTGQGELAGLLLLDRDNIVWNFDSKNNRIKSVEDFINAINESLLNRLQSEEDPFIRSAITEELRRRVIRLSRFLLDELKEHELLRHSLLSLIGFEERDLRIDSVRSDLEKRPYLLFDDHLENARKRNMASLKMMKHHVMTTQGKTEHLMASLSQCQSMLEASQKKVADLERAAEVKDDQSFVFLQKVIMDQDDNIARLRNSIKSYEDLVNVPRCEVVELLSSIRHTCPRASSLPLPRGTAAAEGGGGGARRNPEPAAGGDPGTWSEGLGAELLRGHVKVIVDYCEHQKLRIQQGSQKIVELEKERGTMKTLLNARGTTALPAVLSTQLRAFREQKFDMNETIKSLRQKMEQLNQDREQMQSRLDELSAILDMDNLSEQSGPIGGGGDARFPPRRARKKSARRRRRSSRASISALSEEGAQTITRAKSKVSMEDHVLGLGEDANNNIEKAAQMKANISRDRDTLISQYVNMQSNKVSALTAVQS